MATTNVSSPSKVEVYESLYLICHATQQIIDHIERLRSANVLRPSLVKLQKSAAHQLRSEITSSAVHNLTAPENAEAFRYQNERIRVERKLAHVGWKSSSKRK